MPGDNTDYFKAISRMFKSACIRVLDGDTADLLELQNLVNDVNNMLTDTCIELHEQGFSLAEIAYEFGVTRQAIWQRIQRRKNAIPKEKKHPTTNEIAKAKQKTLPFN